MPVMVKGPAVLVKAILPLVIFDALKIETALAPFKVSPPTELLVSVPVVLIKPAPLSAIVPLEVKPTLFAPPASVPVMLILPVLLTDTAPVPVCVMPVIANGAAVFTKEIKPVPLFVALKLVTVFALPKVVPVAELVVSRPPFNKPAPASLMAPAVPVSEMPPVVLIPPAFNVTLRPAVALIAPDVLPTLALKRISLVAPVADKVTPPLPPAVTALPSVSVPVLFKVMLPLLPVLIAPVVVNAPVLPTTILPPPDWVMPVMVKGPAVLVKAILPLVIFDALKIETALAPFRVSPPTELLVSVPVVLIKPEPVSDNVPLEVKPILLAAPAIVPVIAMLPVLFTDSAPVPVCDIPVIVNAEPLVSDNAPPPVFVALKLAIRFAPPRVSPPKETLVSVPVVLIKPAALSTIVPLEFKPMLFAPPATVPVILILPVLLTDTAPVPVCEIPVITNGAAVFIKEIKPAPLFEPLKLVTVFALPKVVPVAELVVRRPPFNKPAPASLTAPTVPVSEIPPVVLILPAFSVTLRPAAALMAPDVLPTLALKRISLVAPVADKVTPPLPPAVTVPPTVSVPPVAVKLMLPLLAVTIAPLVVSAPALPTTMLPPPD